MGLGDDDAHLIEGAVGHEGGEGGEPGHEAEGGHAGGHADHVLLGDAHLEEAIGMGGGEDVGPGRVGEITIEHDQIGILVGQIGQGLTPDIAQGKHLGASQGQGLDASRFTDRAAHDALPLPLPLSLPIVANRASNSACAAVRLSSVGTLACQR